MIRMAGEYRDSFCDGLPPGKSKAHWIVFWGSSGVGKTFLAKLLYIWWRNIGKWYECPITGANLVKSGRFADWRECVDKLKGGEFDLIEGLIEQDFLVLDDIGSERDTSGFVTDRMDRVLSARLGKWTIITTNLSLEAISERLDTRIASRILRDGNILCDCNTIDFNLR